MNGFAVLKIIKKIVILAVEVCIIAVLVYGVNLFSKINNVSTVEVDEEKVVVNEDIEEETVASFTGYTTIALFGLDNRTSGVYETGNSDVIMIIAINNDTQEMNLVSVYRDTFLNTASEEVSFHKANAAYAAGGVEQAISMLNKNLDLDIPSTNYISFDFKAVADVIDIIGGVTINITSEEELEYLNYYIDHTNGILGTDSPSVSGTGKQKLDGVQAVAYSRIRYTSGGDYRRAQRQRVVLSKMIKKVKKASLSELTQILDEVFPEIETGLSQSDLLDMASVMLKYDMEEMSGFPFDRATKTIGSKGSVVVPCDLVSNVTELHKLLYANETYTPSETVQSYSAQITSETGYTAESAISDDYSESDDLSELNGNSSSSDESSDESSESTDSTEY